MTNKSFPKMLSMPLIRVQVTQPSDDIPMRSIETENLDNLEESTSPYTDRLTAANNWTPISISSESSDNEDEKDDRVDHSLRGEISLLNRNKPLILLIESYLRYLEFDMQRSQRYFIPSYLCRLPSAANCDEKATKHVELEK